DRRIALRILGRRRRRAIFLRGVVPRTSNAQGKAETRKDRKRETKGHAASYNSEKKRRNWRRNTMKTGEHTKRTMRLCRRFYKGTRTRRLCIHSHRRLC